MIRPPPRSPLFPSPPLFRPRAQQAPAGPRARTPDVCPPAAAVHAHPVEHGLAGAPRPAARPQVDAMPPLDQPAEDLVEVDFGAAGVWILTVVPVDQQDPHSAPNSRATASSTPFTNAGALAPANQWASFTASSMTTRGGVAPSASSASARRRMLFSTTPTRSSRQCSAASATRRSNSGSPAIAFAARSAPRSKPSGMCPNPPARRDTSVAIDGRPDNSHAYRSWRARARALVSGRCTAELGQDVGCGERRLGRFVALVPGRASRPRQRLLERFGGQHPEPDGEPMSERDVAEPARRLARDVLEVRRLASDHAAERHDRPIPPARGRSFRGHRQLERPRDPDHVHPRVRHALLLQAAARSLEQPARDGLVIAGDQHGHADLTRRAGRTLELGHGQWVSRWPSLSRLASR